MQRPHRIFFLACLASLPLAFAACNNPIGRNPREINVQADRVTKEELLDVLAQYEDSFEATVRRAADELLQRDPSRKTRRLTLLWQMRVLPMARDALDADDPLRGFLDIWTLAVRMRQYLEKGEGKTLFAANQGVAVHYALQCETEIERVALLIMDESRVSAARKDVRALAAAHPLRTEFSGGEVRTSLGVTKASPVLQTVLAVPLAPFRAFEGIDRSAAAIRGFTAVAARLTDVAQGLAADARLQLELLLLETEDIETVRSATESFRKLADSSEKLSAAAESLPKSLKHELVDSLDAVDSKQANFQKTLNDTKEAADKLQHAGEKIAEAGRAWSGTAKSIEDMVASFRKPTGTSTAQTGPPFDINDYGRTADSLTKAAVELQKLVADLRELSESKALTTPIDELDTRLGKIVLKGGETASEIVDRLIWRLAALVLAVLFIVFMYQRFTRRAN